MNKLSKIFSVFIIFWLILLSPTPTRAQTLYQCQPQPAGGCWKLVNYTDYATECDDQYNNSPTICWVECPASACSTTSGTSGTSGSTTKSIDSVFGQITPPSFVSHIGTGSAGLSQFFKTVIGLIYAASMLAFVVMILISAFQWITSGGDKEALGKARSRLTNALIGIVLLAFAGFIIVNLGKILGFQFFG